MIGKPKVVYVKKKRSTITASSVAEIAHEMRSECLKHADTCKAFNGCRWGWLCEATLKKGVDIPADTKEEIVAKNIRSALITLKNSHRRLVSLVLDLYHQWQNLPTKFNSLIVDVKVTAATRMTPAIKRIEHFIEEVLND